MTAAAASERTLAELTFIPLIVTDAGDLRGAALTGRLHE
jgi:hypothetical protein